MYNTLIVAVHPDDETLGAGGTLLKKKSNGEQIHWVIITNISEELGFTKEQVEIRHKEIKEVSKRYQFDSVISLNLPAIKLETIEKNVLIDKLSSAINKIKPSTIILPFKGDVHSEHRFVFDAAFSCTKIFRYPFIKEIIMMETLSETDFAPALSEYAFIPNYFVDISLYINEKIEIMQVYKSEIGEHPFPRSKESIRSLGILRGTQSGVKFAEAFVILKRIES